MEVTYIYDGDSHYPSQLRLCLGENAPKTLSFMGKVDILNSRPLAFFCSKKCPGNLILKTYDLAQRLRKAGTSVISGFHSPIERECLNIILRGAGPIIICPARGLERMRITKECVKAIDGGRLLLISPFSDKTRRADIKLTGIRNGIVAVIANQVFVAHAEIGSKTEALCREMVTWRKPFFTFEDNHRLLELGARSVLDLKH
jgi:predicted Rossmann fold nucleotide-binding protein DprA/Smf involved in DNA uptake